MLLAWVTPLAGMAETRAGTVVLPPNMPPPDMSKAQAHDSFVELIGRAMSGINNKGVQMRIAQGVASILPRVADDLQHAKGVLVIIPVQVSQTDSGDYQSLIGSGLEYVGIGSSPADANLAYTSSDRLSQGGKPDPEASLSYWFTKSSDGSIKIAYSQLSWLKRGTFALYGERKLAKYDWVRARQDEVGRLARSFAAQTRDANLQSEMTKLENQRTAALKELDELNRRLYEELAQAQRAAESGRILQLVGFGLELYQFKLKASEGLNPANKAALMNEQTSAGVLQKLTEIETNSNSEATLIQQRVLVETNTYDGIETKQIYILQKSRVPVGNLPSGSDPQLEQP
ncbi:hypothetical protein [Variovorax sp. J22R115]|uniref:hypothetical protein n=1 Tax=Variovorax sp. J22R115 TaxID=3053509 RepID=UPI002574B9E5|nr:hypothetical protein [Variovorax sp. J22R115]MDM0049926.1 hypothetical protein [Variovorax sp. J22R115]